MDKWEYLIIKGRNVDQANMNSLGNEGWELVSFAQYPTSAYVFKRPLVLEQLYWRDVNSKHHGLKVSVNASSTPDSPWLGGRPVEGIIECKHDTFVPILRAGTNVHSFDGYWVVTILKEE